MLKLVKNFIIDFAVQVRCWVVLPSYSYRESFVQMEDREESFADN
jgi:hypothetical protein